MLFEGANGLKLLKMKLRWIFITGYFARQRAKTPTATFRRRTYSYFLTHSGNELSLFYSLHPPIIMYGRLGYSCYSAGLSGFLRFCCCMHCALYISNAGCHFETRTGQLKGCKPEHHTSQPHGFRVRESIEGRVGSWPTSLVANSLVSNRFWGSRSRVLWGGRKHDSPKNACFKISVLDNDLV